MMPPICEICDEDFRPSDGGLIYFTESKKDKESNKRFEEPGFVGHPSNAVWFCEKHYKIAKQFSELTRAQAMPKILAQTDTKSAKKQTAKVEFLFSDGELTERRTVEDNQFSDAIYNPAEKQSLIRFQQGKGLIVWSIYISNSQKAGTEKLGKDPQGTWFALSVSDKSLAARFQASYGGAQHQSGEINFTKAQIGDGGEIAGIGRITLESTSRPGSKVEMKIDFVACFPE